MEDQTADILTKSLGPEKYVNWDKVGVVGRFTNKGGC